VADKSIEISGDEIQVRFPYCTGLINRIKELPDRQWHPEDKYWSVPATKFHAERVRKFAVDYKFSLPPEVIKLAQQPKATVTSLPFAGLRPYQERDVNYMLATNGRVLNASAMGTGKTITTLAYIKLAKVQRTLVVCPASVVYKWQVEVAKWLGEDVLCYVIKDGQHEKVDASIFIISYDLLIRRCDEIKQSHHFDLLVADECHKIANPKTLRYAAIKSIPSKKFIGLSGTPFLNRPVELFTTLNIIDKTNFTSYWNYLKRYCNAHKDRFGYWDYSGHSNEKELRERINPFFFRHTKEELKDELPQLTRSVIPVEVDKGEYRKAIREARATGNPLSATQVLRHTLGSMKVAVACELAEDILSDLDTKIVVYCFHLDVVDMVCNKLNEYGVLTIVGADSQEKRQESITRFQQKGGERVMVITAAGGEGIDLYRASHIIFVEREWNPGKEEQAEGRLHRIGQENKVIAYYLVAQGTIDVLIDDMIDNKRSVFNNIIGSEKIEKQFLSKLWSEINND
jgi:SWI/SNF-related matrix-associated actin-dependent regulator of chromatin subfamily A-like protein 1